MTAKELARLVKECRDTQRLYFRTRTPAILERSKELERQVDKAVAEVLSAQPGLFGKAS